MNYIEVYKQLKIGEYILKDNTVYYKPGYHFLYKYDGKLLEHHYVIDNDHTTDNIKVYGVANELKIKLKRILKYHRYKQNKAVT